MPVKKKSNIEQLDVLLQKYYAIGPTTYYNVVKIKANSGGRYNVTETIKNDFFLLLNNIYNNNEVGANYCEFIHLDKPAGLYIDIDIITNDSEYFLCDDIDLISSINKLFKEILKTSCKNLADYHICYLSKDKNKPNESNYKNGTHILIPDVWVHANHRKYIIDKLSESLENILATNCSILNPKTALDKSACLANRPCMLIGCCKPADTSIYRIKNVYKFFNTDHHRLIKHKELPNAALSFSITFTDPVFAKNIYECAIYIPAIINNHHFDEGSRAKYIWDLLQIVPAEYYNDYNSWIKIMCILANEHRRGLVNARYIAELFSKKSSTKFNEHDFNFKWNNLLKSTYSGRRATLASLKIIAKNADLEQYNEIVKIYTNNRFLELLEQNSIDGTFGHFEYANLLYEEFHDLIKYSNNNWYVFITEQFIDNCNFYSHQIYKWMCWPSGNGLFKVFYDYLENIKNQMLRLNREAEDEKTKKITKEVFKRLQNISMISSIIMAAETKFSNINFAVDLDTEKNVIGVQNGVLVVGPECSLVAEIHDHPVSKYVNVEWAPYVENEYTAKIMNILRDIFPEPDVLEFMLFHASTGLDRMPADNMLVMLHGTGSNGKSMFFKYIKETLMPYVDKVRMELFTNPPETSDKANSSRYLLSKLNWAYADETNRGPVLNSESLKKIINTDAQNARELYKTEITFKNCANIIIASNYEFRVDANDYGTWRRIKFYEMKHKFVDDPRESGQKKKMLDYDYLMDMPEYRQAMLAILTHYYERLCREHGRKLENVKCPTMDAETRVYRCKQDPCHKFITERLVRDVNSVISSTELVASFRTWVRMFDNYNGSFSATLDLMKNSELQNYFNVSNDLVGWQFV